MSHFAQNNCAKQQQPPPPQQSLYTYHLPYGIRRDICNLLDADQSWRLLGGQFVGLDATQLTLIGQAYLRNGSPTDELLNRLDSANVRITEFCSYLKQMNHCRALELLRPFLQDINPEHPQLHHTNRIDNMDAIISTLDTPTPSFAENEQPSGLMALIGGQDLYPYENQFQQPPRADPWTDGGDIREGRVAPQPVNKCHRSSPGYQPEPENTQNKYQRVEQSHQNQPRQVLQANHEAHDPGEEIVRMACANNRKRTSISDQEVVNQLRLIMQINYMELKLASDDFSDANILGNGGFASVYRGNWKGTDVAIKRLKCNLMDQALNELTILNSYRIDNILPIYGISIDGPEACLVYQFMANGSLEDRLSCKKNTPPLTWNQRAQIGEGVAKGLYYLHTLRDKPLVHGDVKSANVLLDSQFVPKLGDFGLARQVFKGKNPQTELCTHCTVSSIHGTSVYLPPEYLRHKILSPAVDVYSYGIVLLEMATGKRAYDGKRLLIDMVEDETQSMSAGEISYSLKDSRLADDTQNDLKIWYELLIKLGLNCAHKIKKKRPDMGQVLSKFVNFRNNTDLDKFNSIQNQLLLAQINSNGSTTARTLTPELSVSNHQVEFAERNRQHPDSLHRQPGTEVTPGLRQQVAANNSALMSVEEAPELEAHYRDADGKDFTHHAGEAASVEAMIPLLTELGVKQE